MSFKPTEQQLKAINTPGSVLVSAAAGSGKTAVLVERVIKMLSDEKNPIWANRILIATFTNLAASELRTRIEKRLQEEIDKNPDNYILQKQKILISAAQICTIDSFCIDFIRENFQLAGINPSFKIADNSTISYLKKAIIDRIFGEYFNKNDADFINLIYLVGAEYDDRTLMDFVLEIFDYSRQMPYPSVWLDRIRRRYIDHAEGNCNDWFVETLESANKLFTDSTQLINSAVLMLSDNETAYSAYEAHYLYLKEFLDSLSSYFENNDWDNIYNALYSVYDPPALGRLKSSEKTQQVELALLFRKEVLENIKGLKGVIYAEKKEVVNQLKQISPYIYKLIEIISRFEKEFYDELYKRNLMTFYMCEQEALAMLTEVIDGQIVVREEAKEFISTFDAVFVDEYQDTNDLQDKLATVLSDNSKKLFCVGDIKQSIYRFRGANPYNFLARKVNGGQLKVDLGCNFRSRKEICEFINRFFRLFMYKETSGFDYDEKEKLVSSAAFPENSQTKTEIHISNLENIFKKFNPYQTKSENSAAAEANIIADIIIANMNAPAFIKEKDNTLRKARFDDFAILYRSLSANGDVISRTLKARGIPVSVDFGGLLEADEVKTVISFLRVINNPNDDIALLTLLTSPLFAFKIDEITEIRLKAKKERLIHAVLISAKEENEKSKNFIEVLSYFTDRRIMFGLQELIEEIFEKTNFLNIVSRQSSGEEKRNNLLSFQRFAAEADSKNQSLRAFLNSIESLTSQDFKKPKVFLSESVKLMSIHASKGLQFPVCIIADASHQFNFQDINSSLILDEVKGFAFKCKNIDTAPDNNILRNIIKTKAKKELLAEELRLLYVAMTRAEDKLIISASVDDFLKSILLVTEKLLQHPNENRIERSIFNSLKSYFDFILAYLSHEFSCESLLSGLEEEFILDETKVYIHNVITTENSYLENTSEVTPKKNTEKLLKSFNYTYPFEPLSELEAKASVTKLVHEADGKKFEFSSKPSFMLENGLSTAEKGTAMHKFMQHCDFEAASTNLEAEILRLYDFGYLTEIESEAIEKTKLASFFESEFYLRIKASKQIRREERFITEFPATELKPSLDKSFSDEMIVVQGAVDLMFFEDDGVVIVDFKTDRNSNEQELLETYSEQLKFYSHAIQKLFNKPVKELFIYSFSLNKAIKV